MSAATSASATEPLIQLTIPQHNYHTHIVVPEYGIIIPYVVLHPPIVLSLTQAQIEAYNTGSMRLNLPYNGGYVPFVIPQTGEQRLYYVEPHTIQL